MTPNQIYALPYESAQTEDHYEWGQGHFPELDAYLYEGFEPTPLVEFRTVKYVYIDGRRYWSLRTVWYQGHPVMILQNAGREGDDHKQRFITDGSRFAHMLEYIRSKHIPSESFTSDYVDPDLDNPSLTSFYGMSL